MFLPDLEIFGERSVDVTGLRKWLAVQMAANTVVHSFQNAMIPSYQSSNGNSPMRFS